MRQSSAHQVLHNRESSALQYAMRDRLVTLGWSCIETIDEDLGRSAAGGVTRAGFDRMVAEVCLGKVGAVAAREVSRFEALFEEELAAYLGRIRYGRGGAARKEYRHGRHERQLVGTFGAETVNVPRARIEGEDGKTTEWRSKALPRYQRLTKRAEAQIAAIYLAGTNTRRVKRALFGLFQGRSAKTSSAGRRAR